MSELGFWIPSLETLLTFYFFNVVPLLTLLLIITYFTLRRFNISSKKSVITAFCTPFVVVGIFCLIASIVNSDSNYLTIAMVAFVYGLPGIVIAAVLSYLYYKTTSKGILWALIIIVISIGLFFFFYPKKMVYDENKEASIFYVSDSILGINQDEPYVPHRFVTRQSCSCFGISEEPYLSAYYSPYCFGMTINCKEVTFDACEMILPELMCPDTTGEL